MKEQTIDNVQDLRIRKTWKETFDLTVKSVDGDEETEKTFKDIITFGLRFHVGTKSATVDLLE